MLGETTFAPDAAAELSKQIQALEPSAAILSTKGFGWEVAAALASSIKSGKPDIEELRSNGIDLKTAIAICEAISSRHARRNAAIAAMAPMAPKPLPKPAPTASARLETHEDIRMAALSILHDLALQLESGRGDAVQLHRAGFSLATSRELAGYINASRTGARWPPVRTMENT